MTLYILDRALYQLSYIYIGPRSVYDTLYTGRGIEYNVWRQCTEIVPLTARKFLSVLAAARWGELVANLRSASADFLLSSTTASLNRSAETRVDVYSNVGLLIHRALT